MRAIRVFLFTGALCGAVAPSFAAPPQKPGPAAEGQSLADVFFPELPSRSLEAARKVAGLSPASEPEVLSWKLVYALALARARAGATVLDPNVVARLAKLMEGRELPDFQGFRRAFLTGRLEMGGPFRDPSGDYLELLRRLLAVDHARRDAALWENCGQFYRELIEGEFSVVAQSQLEWAEASAGQARQAVAQATARFQDQLDEVKAALRLPLDAPWIVDHRDVAAFRETLEEVYNWHRDPNRTLEVLSRRVARVPGPGEVAIDGKPALGAIEADPGRLEDVLASAVRLAEENRNKRGPGKPPRDMDVPRALRIRRRIRFLAEIRRVHRAERRHLELASRSLDKTLMPITDRPMEKSTELEVVRATGSMLGQTIEIRKVQDRLVEFWASFQKERLALYRDLGVLPYDDWKSFLDDLAARPGPVEK